MISLATIKKLAAKYQNWLIIGLFVLVPMIMLFPFAHAGQMAICSDWAFHSARVEQMTENIKAGHWLTFIGTNQFNHLGSASFLFYPTVFFYPWALLKIVIHSQVTAYFAFVLLMYWTTLGISYYSMYQFSKSKLRSVIFALAYLIVPYHLYLTLDNYVLGEALAYMFLPLVLLGTWRLLVQHRWKTLAVGLTLVGYCHIVSVIISFEMIAALTVIKFILDRKIDWQAVKQFCYAGVLTLVLVAWELVPFVTDFHGLFQPTPGFSFAAPLGEVVTTAVGNQAVNNGGVGLLAVITLAAGWKICRSKTDWVIYGMGIIVFVMTTAFVPWHFIVRTPLATVQFPFRYNSFAGLFLMVIFSKGVCQLMTSVKWSRLLKLSVVAASCLWLFFGSVQSQLERNQNIHGDVTVLKPKKSHKYATLHHGVDKPVIVTNQTYHRQFEYGIIYGETDYWPMAAFNHSAKILNLRQTHHRQAGPNKLTFTVKLKHPRAVELPALKYHRTVAFDNGRKIAASTSHRGLVKVHLSEGTHHVTVSYQPARAYTVLMLAAVTVWLSLIAYQLVTSRMQREAGSHGN